MKPVTLRGHGRSRCACRLVRRDLRGDKKRRSMLEMQDRIERRLFSHKKRAIARRVEVPSNEPRGLDDASTRTNCFWIWATRAQLSIYEDISAFLPPLI